MQEYITVGDVVSIDMAELIKMTPLASGEEKYVRYVIRENGTVLGAFYGNEMSGEILNREITNWQVENDPQDIDSLVVWVVL